MVMIVMLFGTDIRSDWSFNEHGDLTLVGNKDNVGQAISNRLQTQLNELDLFYAGYGSFLTQFLGWKRNNSTLEFMRLEIETRLAGDPRLTSYTVNLEYGEETNTVEIHISLTLDDGEEYTGNFVLNNDGVVVGE